eukprot:gene8075-9591_t
MARGVGSELPRQAEHKKGAISSVLRSLLHPEKALVGEYAAGPLDTNFPINDSQRMAVDSLRNVVEKIHGPPGTGKSSTIYHIIHSRIPPGKSVLVTCARNKAVNSMVDKLRSRHKDVVVWGNINAPDLSPASKELFLEQLAHRERQQQSADAALAPPDPSRRAAPKPDEKMVRQSILSRVRIHLCTIDSTTRFLVRWKEEMKGHESSRKLELHTVIVDEAGCASESSMSLLVWLEPKNLILVGDHKQLGPFTQ